jgi:diamine N-acetyltransferase
VVEIIVEKVTANDVATLSALAKQTFYDAFVGTCTAEDMQAFLELYYSEQALLQQLINPAIQYYFAKHNNEAIAYISFGIEMPGFPETGAAQAVELKRLYVQKPYHGKLVAQMLVDVYFNYVAQTRLPFAFLGVWEYNCKAENFYNKFGFVRTNNKHDFPIGSTLQTDVYLLKKI